jgi:hypothetical protein
MNTDLISPEDQTLLNAVPGYLSITQMLKATPAVESGERFIYLEASNESVDQQNEVVLAKALSDSSDYYLKFGNLDIDHYTQIGARSGIPNYELFEIGRPVSVTVRDGRTFVKGQIYSGAGPAAEKANAFWSSLTELSPPARWYPSVGGAVISKSVVIDPETRGKRAVINKVRWSNIGFSKTPVNANLATVSTVPFGALAKSWSADGFDFAKAIEAGYGTDSAALAGGGALRKQSLEGGVMSYWDFRDDLASRIRSGEVKSYKPAELVKVAQARYGMSPDIAAASVGRFLGDLENGLRKNNR